MCCYVFIHFCPSSIPKPKKKKTKNHFELKKRKKKYKTEMKIPKWIKSNESINDHQHKSLHNWGTIAAFSSSRMRNRDRQRERLRQRGKGKEREGEIKRKIERGREREREWLKMKKRMKRALSRRNPTINGQLSESMRFFFQKYLCYCWNEIMAQIDWQIQCKYADILLNHKKKFLDFILPNDIWPKITFQFHSHAIYFF